MDHSLRAEKPSHEKVWILNVIGALFFAGLAWWSYAHIAGMEAKGRVILNKFLSLPYDLWGKEGVAGFWMLFVAYNVIKGIYLVIKER
jgi:hypothetical protein